MKLRSRIAVTYISLPVAGVVLVSLISSWQIRQFIATRSSRTLAAQAELLGRQMERGLLQPPTDQDLLERIASVLKISNDTEEFAKLRDLAFLSRGQVPDDILSEKELVECLPMIFRTLRSDEKPTPAQLRKLADKLRHDQRKKVQS